MEVRCKEDRSKMKVDYNDADSTLRLAKIQVRWYSDTSKIKVRWR